MMRPAFAVVFTGLALLGGLLGAAAQDQSQPPAQVQPQQAQTQPAQPQPPVPPQAVPAPPQGLPPQAENARYSFHRIGDTFVRLDSVTGQVAQCSQAPSGWTCSAAPEERAALESEIARLQRENAGLKKTLLARGGDVPGVTVEPRPVPPGTVPDPSKPPADLKLPSDAEIDRALAYMKNVWRKLVDMMQDLQRDIQQRKG
jgi:hypothetical protein